MHSWRSFWPNKRRSRKRKRLLGKTVRTSFHLRRLPDVLICESEVKKRTAEMALQDQESDSDEESERPKRKKSKNKAVVASSDEEDQGSVSGKETRDINEHEGTEGIEEIARPSAALQRRMSVLYGLDGLLTSAYCSQTTTSLEGQGGTT